MNILVFSQDRFVEYLNDNEKVLRQTPFFTIRISSAGFQDTCLDDLLLNDNLDIERVFNFPDMEAEMYEKYKQDFEDAERRTGVRQYPIKPEEVQEIFEFVRKHKDKELLLIHCDAGECRSWTTAFCIAKYVLKDEALTQEIRSKVIRFSKTIEEAFRQYCILENQTGTQMINNPEL